jgi:hypothetical protein
LIERFSNPQRVEGANYIVAFDDGVIAIIKSHAAHH